MSIDKKRKNVIIMTNEENGKKKMGRPIVGDEPKNKQIALRAKLSTVLKFQKCAEITGETKTDLLEKMVNQLYDKLTKK